MNSESTMHFKRGYSLVVKASFILVYIVIVTTSSCNKKERFAKKLSSLKMITSLIKFKK
jgi:hypothetical protein